MPWAVRQQCLNIVRDYDRMRREYKKLRGDILDASGGHYTTYVVDGEERRAFMPSTHNASRTTEDKQMQLEALEQTLMVKQLRAVDHSLAKVGEGMPEMFQDMLQDAIMTSCKYGREYPYERLCVVGFSKTSFFRARDEFLLGIATELGIII